MSLSMFANDHAGRLLLRLGIGFTLLLHGVAKVGDKPTLAAISERLELWHLPGWLCYGVFAGELIAPVLILLGAYVRLSSVVVALNLVAAIVLFQTDHVFELGTGGGWHLEREVMWLAGALSLIFMGGGRYGLRPD